MPYAAYKLVRIMRLFELPCEGWQGWHMHSGRLWSPEGYAFQPHDANWWNLLVRRAEGFGRQYTRANQLDVALQRLQGTDDAAAATDATSSAGADGVAATSPAAAGGRAAKPTGPNLLLEHFRTRINGGDFFCPPVSLGKRPVLPATENVATGGQASVKFPQYEKSTKGGQA